MREQVERLRKFTAGSFAIAAAARQQAQMQPRHRECGIQIGGDAVMLDRTLMDALRAPGTGREHSAPPALSPSDRSSAANDVVGGLDLAAVHQQHGLEQQCIAILPRQSRGHADMIQRLGESLLAQQVQCRRRIERG